MKIETTEQAFDLLKTHRAEAIARGIEVAQALLKTRESITARDVYDAMVAEGSYPDDLPNGRWLGMVFRHPAFEKTGEMIRATYGKQRGAFISYWRAA